MNDVTVSVLDPSVELRLHRLTGAFLAGYRNANTRTAYLQQLHRWFAWCTAHQLDPLNVETPRRTRLTRHELADWLNAAEHTGGAIYAMAHRDRHRRVGGTARGRQLIGCADDVIDWRGWNLEPDTDCAPVRDE